VTEFPNMHNKKTGEKTMIEKLLGIGDKSIVKKSTYYVYLLGGLLGMAIIIIGIGSFMFSYSDTYKGTILYQNKNMEYLKQLSHETKDEKLLDIAQLCEINLNSNIEMYQNTSFLFIVLGFLFTLNFILFNELRKKVLDSSTYSDERQEKE